MDAVSDFIARLLAEIWALSQAMGPWLLLGFLMAGMLSQLVPESFVRRHLAQGGFKSIVKAVLIGMPLPVCSCGVIPLAAGLRKAGASKGVVAAFTVATPQTGVDSIAVTYSLMGLPFTIGRMVSDVISGLMAGLLIDGTRTRAERAENAPPPEEKKPACPHCAAKGKADAPRPPWPARIWAMFKEAFFGLPSEIGKYVMLGIFVGALISVVFPKDSLAGYVSNPWLAYAVVSVVAIPMYVCSTGAIPVAFGLIAAGFSPGAAIVFLALGPATNAATVAVLWKLLGRKATVLYLFSLTATAWTVGFAFDRFGWTVDTAHAGHVHDGSFTSVFFGAAMLAMFALAWVFKKPKAKEGESKGSCCA